MEPTFTSLRSYAPGAPRPGDPYQPAPIRDRYWLHILLFLLTLASTIYTGGQWMGGELRYRDWGDWWFIPDGVIFGLALLLFLTVHEFGHYIAARRHGINTSLPYYIPMPFIAFGTLGAVIRIREPIPSTRKLFDVGASGPLAGFVVALGLLLVALFTLPAPDYLFGLTGHEEIKQYIQQYGRFPDHLLQVSPQDGGITIVMGQTILFWFLSQFFANVPPMYEVYHYPVLFAGWLGLFFTALNLLPVGQLDGGHILYALVGPKWHARLARMFVVVLLISGSIGFVDEMVPSFREYAPWAGEASLFLLAGILYFYLYRTFNRDHRLIAPTLLGIIVVVFLARWIGPVAQSFGYTGWLVFTLLIVVFVRVDHPPVLYREPLTRGRFWLGIASIIIFILCFSIRPLYIV